MKYVIILMLIFTFTSCNSTSSEKSIPNQISAEKIEYKKITPEQAKKILDENKDVVLLDVRTQEEFDNKRINGAILIPDYDINSKAELILKDKDATILVYCRSGNRSKTAAQQLISMGYKNVYDFGGINDWKYDTVGGK